MPLARFHESLTVDRASPVPLYHQLRVIFQRNIEAGEWQPDFQIPTEDSIAAQYRVSKVTVRQALKQLSDEGLLRREQGRGTFVSRPKVEQGPRKLTSFSEEMQQRGLRASSRVLEQEITPAGDQIAERLAIPSADPVFRLKRLRLANDEPMGIQTLYVPMRLVPGIERYDFANLSLYEVLNGRYGLKPARAREEHFAVALERNDGDLLGLEAGSPALGAERLAFREDGTPIELTLSVMRGDRYKIVLNLTNFAG